MILEKHGGDAAMLLFLEDGEEPLDEAVLIATLGLHFRIQVASAPLPARRGRGDLSQARACIAASPSRRDHRADQAVGG